MADEADTLLIAVDHWRRDRCAAVPRRVRRRHRSDDRDRLDRRAGQQHAQPARGQREPRARQGVGSWRRAPPTSSGIIEGPGGFGVADQAARAEGIRLVLLGPDGHVRSVAAARTRSALAVWRRSSMRSTPRSAAIGPPLIDAVTDRPPRCKPRTTRTRRCASLCRPNWSARWVSR